MISFAGSKGSLKLFVDNDSAVVVDTSVNMIVGSGDASVVLSAYEWETPKGTVEPSVLELASSALTTLDINVITASGRMYTIPDGVKAEAKKALEWRKEEKRGGTPVGLNTARTLARGGQIGIEKIRHIAKYFPRHEVDKKGKGWKPGEDNFPSNGRIAWALWGGDAAQRWASAIVERENKKALRAGGYAMPGYDRSPDIYSTPHTYGSDLDSFKAAYELDPTSGPEFMARVRLDGSGFDRLYKIDVDGRVCVWDDGRWDDLGHVDGDVWSYDQALDDEYDDCEKDHVLLDPQTAMLMSAMWQDAPYRFISIDDIDPEEASLVREAYPQEDWKVVDYVITAAGEGGGAVSGTKPSGSINPNDNVDTPAEKAQRASSQQRDATGKFAQAGGRVVVGGDTTNGRGTLLNIGSNGMGTVELDNGRTVDVPVKMTKPEDEVEAAPVAPNPAVGKPLDVDGILGEPRTPKSMPAAQLPGTYPPMGASDLKAVVNDWGNWVNEQRAAFKPLTNDDVRDYARRTNQTPGPGDIRPEGPKKIATVKDGKITTQNIKPASVPSSSKGPGKIPVAPDTRNQSDAGKFPGATSAQKRADATAKNTGPGKIPAAPAALPKPKSDPKSNIGPGKIPASPDKRNPSDAGKFPGATDAQKKADAVTKNTGPGKIPAQPKPLPKPAAESKYGPGKIPVSPDKRNPSDAGKYPGYTADQKKREAIEKNIGPGKIPADALKQPKPQPKSEAPKSNFDKEGRYVVQKGDSLWSIADKNKPQGKSTAEYWAEVMKANPKGNFKSGNPSLIYSGEKVNLPGQKPATPSKPADPRNAPGSNRETKPQDKRNPADAGKYPGYTEDQKRKDATDKNTGPGKIPAQPAAKAKPAAESKFGPGKIPVPGDKRNPADAGKFPGAKSAEKAAEKEKAATEQRIKDNTGPGKIGAPRQEEKKKYNPWTDSEQAKSWQKLGKDVSKGVDDLGKAVAEGAKNLFQPETKGGKAGARKNKK